MPQWLELILRTFMAISFMFILTKMLGKRQLSEMSLFGYISGISIGNIAAYIALEQDENWWLAIIALVLWVLTAVALEYWTIKSKKVRDVVDGKRRMLIADGVVLREALHKERFTVDELLEQLREKDVFRLADVASASLEANGDVSVMLKQEYQPITASMLGYTVPQEKEPVTIISDGSYEFKMMQQNGIAEGWVKKHLKEQNLKVEDVFIAQLTVEQQLTLHTMDERTIEIDLQTDEQKKSMQQQADQMKQALLQAVAYIEQLTKKQQGN